MKKLLFIIAMALSITVQAQDSAKKVWFNPRVGLNFSNMTNFDDSNSRYGLLVGADVETKVNNFSTITAGLAYSQQGCTGREIGVSETIKLDYINIPVLYNIYYTKNLVFKFGFQVGLLVNDKAKVTANGTTVEVDLGDVLNESSSEKVTCESAVVSLPVALGYTFNNKVFAEIRYDIPITAAISAPGEDSKHKNFSISLGYKF